MDCRVECLARAHRRRVFGDMTDTSSLHGFGCQGGHPCRGKRCQLWISGVSLFDLQCRKGRTGENFAGGSESIQIPATSGWLDVPSMRSYRIVPVAPTRARREQTLRSKRVFLPCATPTQHGELARSRAVSKMRGRSLLHLRPYMRSCAGMIASVRHPLVDPRRTSDLRCRRPIFSGKWILRAGYRLRMEPA